MQSGEKRKISYSAISGFAYVIESKNKNEYTLRNWMTPAFEIINMIQSSLKK